MTREEMRLALIVFTGQMNSNEPLDKLHNAGFAYLEGVNRYEERLDRQKVEQVMAALKPLIEDGR